MKTSHAAIAVAVAAAIIVAITLLARDRSTTGGVAVTGVAADAVETQPSYAPSGGQGVSTPGQPFHPATLSVDPATLREADQRLAQEATRKYEAIYALDKADPAQDAKTEQVLAAAIQSPALAEVRSQPLDYQIGCKSSMCRIETSFRESDEANEWATRLMLQMGGSFGSTSTVFTPGGEGQKKVVIYAFRLGREPKA